MKKLLVEGSICIIIILILTSLSPVVGYKTIESNNYFVEVSTEFCGMDMPGHRVQLSSKDAQKLKNLIESIMTKLSNAKTQQHANEIVDWAIVELDKFGLFGDTNLDHVKRVIKRWYVNPDKLVDRLQSVLPFFENNAFCMVVGHTKGTEFVSLLSRIVNYISYLTWDILIGVFLWLLGDLYLAYWDAVRYFIGGSLVFPDEGTIISIGLLGIKIHNGTFEGFGDVWGWGHIGIIGFTGLKISLNPSIGEVFYMDSALKTAIEKIDSL